MHYYIYSTASKESLKIKNYLLENLKDNFVFDGENPSLIISIGGDGTFLRAARQYLYHQNFDKMAFVGISTGKLGFLCDFKGEDASVFLKLLKENKMTFSRYNLIKLQMNGYVEYFINEARVEKIFNTLTCELYLNDQFIETFRGNGFNISSSIGSTGYNRSLGGPLVNPEFNCLILGEEAPINHNVYGSITSFVVLKEDDVITLKGNFHDCFLGGDIIYQLIKKEHENSEIEISLSDKKITFARFKELKYYDKLKMSYVKGM